MATIKPTIADLARNTEATVDVEKIAVPNTTIDGRAHIYDLTKIPAPKAGVERIFVKSLEIKSGERANSNSSKVFGNPEDAYDRIRIHGNVTTFTGGSGSGVALNGDGDVIEVVFYGTGLNLLVVPEPSARQMYATVDGGPEGADFFPTTASAIRSRNYNSNTIVEVVQGLSLGLHTVSIRKDSGGMAFMGVEIVTDVTAFDIPAGNVSGEIVPATTKSFDSGFDLEYGTSGAKGGHIVVYSEDSTVKTAIQWTDATAQYLTSADHANEEVIDRIHWRDFTANKEYKFRSDDMGSAIGSFGSKAFTLHDNETTFVAASGANLNTNEHDEWLSIDSGGGPPIVFTFVGTGLDITRKEDAGATGLAWPVTVDDVAVGNIGDLDASGGIQDREGVQRIVSGLPYGSHTVTIAKGTTPFNIAFQEFIVYGPKKPEIPASAKELGATFKVADFVANTTASHFSMSQGVIAKSGTREMIFEGSPAVNIDNAGPGGFNISSADISNTYQYSFWGTGLVWRIRGDGSMNNNVTIDGLTANTTNFPGLTSQGWGSVSALNTSTGVFTGSGLTYGSGVSISGLPLGYHTVKITKNNANDIRFNRPEIITPIHTRHADSNFVSSRRLGNIGVQSLVTLPSHHKEPVVFSGGVDLGESADLYQRKELDANFSPSNSGTVEYTGVRFSNLTVGKLYTIRYSIYCNPTDNAGDSSFEWYIDHAGAAMDFNARRLDSYPNNDVRILPLVRDVSFIAKGPDIKFRYAAKGAWFVDANPQVTWFELIEHNTMKLTNKF